MFVFSTRFKIHISMRFSLKDKRMVVRSIKDKFRGAFKVPVVEVEQQDNRNIAVLAFTFVCEQKYYGEKLQQKMLDFIEDNCSEEVIEIEEFIEKY